MNKEILSQLFQINMGINKLHQSVLNIMLHQGTYEENPTTPHDNTTTE